MNIENVTDLYFRAIFNLPLRRKENFFFRYVLTLEYFVMLKAEELRL